MGEKIWQLCIKLSAWQLMGGILGRFLKKIIQIKSMIYKNISDFL